MGRCGVNPIAAARARVARFVPLSGPANRIRRRHHGDGPATAYTQNRGPFRDPDEWQTGDEPMTAAQKQYLRTLATEAGEAVGEGLTTAEATQRIEALQQRTGRGRAGRCRRARWRRRRPRHLPPRASRPP